MELGLIGTDAGPEYDVNRCQFWEDTTTCDLPEFPAQSIASNSGSAVLRHHQPQPRVSEVTEYPKHIEPLGTTVAPTIYHRSDIRGSYQPPATRESLRRQTWACFEGTRTATCLRPFFRRRFKTALPQRVFIRALKPCLFFRRRLLGLYVGFILLPQLAVKTSRALRSGSRLTFPHPRDTIGRP